MIFTAILCTLGAKLLTKLLNLFINDMPHHLHNHLAIFTDDTYIFSTNNNMRYAISAITKHLKLLSTWFAKWRVAINVNKTESFLRLKEESWDKYKIAQNNADLPWSNLEVILDQSFIFQQTSPLHLTNSKLLEVNYFP